jgi:hypothetical protein
MKRNGMQAAIEAAFKWQQVLAVAVSVQEIRNFT